MLSSRPLPTALDISCLLPLFEGKTETISLGRTEQGKVGDWGRTQASDGHCNSTAGRVTQPQRDLEQAKAALSYSGY